MLSTGISIIESFRLEKTSKVIESNCKPSTARSTTNIFVCVCVSNSSQRKILNQCLPLLRDQEIQLQAQSHRNSRFINAAAP